MRERVISVVQAFLGGIVIAFVVTVVHAESFPWVVLAGIAVVGCFVVALRLLADDRIVTVAGALGVVVTIFVLAQRSPGGSVLIAANDAGNIWVIGSSLVCGLATVWPEIRRREES